jgi:phage gpG-like protein
MTSITLTYDDKTVLGVLNKIAQSFTPAGMRPAMKEIGEELSESTRRRFETRTGPEGHRWKALKEGTVLARLAKISGAYSQKTGRISTKGAVSAMNMKPLIDTGELSRRIRHQITDGGAGVEIGTNRTFSEGRNVGAEVHQFGTQDGHIPARPFLGLSTKDKTTVLDILNELLQDASRP